MMSDDFEGIVDEIVDDSFRDILDQLDYSDIIVDDEYSASMHRRCPLEFGVDTATGKTCSPSIIAYCVK